MTQAGGPLSEEQARRLWARASELQEEAVRREERGSAVPAHREHRRGFELEHVRAAAMEAGIQKEFVDLAVAEMIAGAEPPDPVLEGRIARFLASRRYALESVRRIDATPQAVLEHLTDFVSRDPYGLTLIDEVGPDVIEGGALIFRAPGMMERKGEFGNALNYSDMRELFFQAKPTEDGRTELRVRAPLLYARRLNYRVGLGLSGALAAGGGAGTGAGAAALLAGVVSGPVGWAAIAGAALAGAAGASFVGVKTYRRLFRYGMKKGQEGLDMLLKVIAVNTKARRPALPASADAPTLPAGTAPQPLSPPSSTGNDGVS